MITKSEKLFVWRTLHGLTLREAATKLGVGKTQYFDMEHGRIPAPLVRTPMKLPAPVLQRLYRRRSGWTLAQAASRAKCSHVTFLARERAGELGAFWKAQKRPV